MTRKKTRYILYHFGSIQHHNNNHITIIAMKTTLTKTQLQFITLQTAWKTITRTDWTEVNVLNDLESPQGIYLSDIARQASGNMNLWFDQAYTIVYDAINSIDIEDLQDYEYIENQEYNSKEFASIYTNTRLQYLTINNQYDITQILRETDCDDIATASSIWYDRVCINILDNIFASLDTITI